MMFDPNTGQPLPYGGNPAPEVGRRNDGAMKCPECGEELADMPHRQKHAVLHYGDELIPPYPDQNTAAERKAALLDVEPESLRGFPRRRW